MSERQAIKLGSIFQLMMLLIYIAQTQLFKHTAESFWSPWLWPSHAGCVIFAYCLFVLYVQKKNTSDLVTDGLFKYTRHPMYTGLALMDTAFWVPRPASTEVLFFALQAVFFICLLTAAWFQEKETLARFGKEAEEYYAKTPRLALLYPLRALKISNLSE